MKKTSMYDLPLIGKAVRIGTRSGHMIDGIVAQIYDDGIMVEMKDGTMLVIPKDGVQIIAELKEKEEAVANEGKNNSQ